MNRTSHDPSADSGFVVDAGATPKATSALASLALWVGLVAVVSGFGAGITLQQNLDMHAQTSSTRTAQAEHASAAKTNLPAAAEDDEPLYEPPPVAY
jgi:hypothetical protein